MRTDRSTPDFLPHGPGEARDWSLLHHRLLLAGMAEGAIHAVNNMLMVLDASMEQLAQDGDGRTEESARLLADMTQAVEQIGHASEQFQRLASPFASGGDAPARLGQALGSAMTMLRVALPRSIRLEPMSPQAEAELENALGRVGVHVLSRLLVSLGLTSNAAMPRGGQARLDLRVVPGDANDADWPQKAELTWEAGGANLSGAILAMAPLDDAPNVTIRVGAEALAAGAGGRLEWIECRPGSVKARLTIPCRPAPPAAPKSPSAARATVLLAAFDDYARSLTAAALRGMGHETICFGRLDRALEAWASVHAAGPCVMIVETSILRSATTEQLDRLSDLGQTDRIILVRGGTREFFAEPLKSCRCSLDKPYSMAQLSALVSRALHDQERKGNKS